MNNDDERHGEHGDKRIRLDERSEVESWTHQLGCSEDELVEAVRAVGPSAGDVRAHFEALLGIPS